MVHPTYQTRYYCGNEGLRAWLRTYEMWYRKAKICCSERTWHKLELHCKLRLTSLTNKLNRHDIGSNCPLLQVYSRKFETRCASRNTLMLYCNCRVSLSPAYRPGLRPFLRFGLLHCPLISKYSQWILTFEDLSDNSYASMGRVAQHVQTVPF